MTLAISSSVEVVTVESETSSVVEIQTGARGAKGDSIDFDSLTEEQKDDLRGELNNVSAVDVSINSLTAGNSSVTATNVQEALEQQDSKIIYGGAF